jgi:hypothetical protein
MNQSNWKKFADIKLKDNDSRLEYQSTDGDGFKLIPFFEYGYNLKFTDTNAIKDETANKTDGEINTEEAQKQKTLATSADNAQNLKPDSLQLIINPNNIALTLDNEDASMLSLADRSTRTTAYKAQSVDPTR